MSHASETKKMKKLNAEAESNQSKQDAKDFEKIVETLSILSDFDATRARNFIIHPELILGLIDKSACYIKCPYAMHAILLALVGENSTDILNDMSDNTIATLKQCIIIAKKMPRLNIRKIKAAIKANQVKIHDNKTPPAECTECKRVIKTLMVSEHINGLLYEDAVSELQKWSDAIDNFQRSQKVVDQESGQTVPEKLLFTPISDLGLPLRTQNCLEKAGIEFICDLIQYSKSDFRKIHGLGPKGYHSVVSYLLPKLGLDLGMKLSNESLQTIESFKSAPVATDNLKLNIRKTNLLKRTKNCLLANGIDTVNKLIHTTKEELYKIHGFGRRSMYDIEYMLEHMGLNLADAANAKTKPHEEASAVLESDEPKTMLDIAALEVYAEKLVTLLDCAKIKYDAAKKSGDESLRVALNENDINLRKRYIKDAGECADTADKALQECNLLSKRIDDAKKLAKTYYTAKDAFNNANKAIAEFLKNQNTK